MKRNASKRDERRGRVATSTKVFEFVKLLLRPQKRRNR